MANQKSATTALTASKIILNGISIQCPKLQNTVVDWATQLLTKSDTKRNCPLQYAHVILFGSHRKALALNFLQRNTTQLTLLESTQHDASVQREFVAKYLKDNQKNYQTISEKTVSCDYSNNNYVSANEPNTQCNVNWPSKNFSSSTTLLTAYHASFKDLLVPSKSKPYNEKFLKKVMLPDVEFFAQAGVAEQEIETLAIGCLPSPALQISLLNSLYKQWIVYLHNFYENLLKNSGEKEWDERQVQSVYKISNFTLITFLHSTTFAQLICGKTDPIVANTNSFPDKHSVTWLEGSKASGDLDFFAKSHRHFSFLFNLFFEVKLLNGWQGFSSDSFAPIVPEFKETKNRTEKLDKIGLKSNEFYPVQVRPRKKTDLSALLLTVGVDLLSNAEEIFQIAFWLIELTPDMRGSKLCCDELSRLLETNKISVKQVSGLLAEKRLVNAIRPHEFFDSYVEVRNIFQNSCLRSSEIMQKNYLAFREKFLKSSVKNYVD